MILVSIKGVLSFVTRSQNQEKSHKLTKTFQQVAAVYQQTSSQGAAQNMFRLYYGDAKYFCICFDSEHIIEQCPIMVSEVMTIVQQEKESNLAKRLVSNPRVSHKNGRQPYYGQRRADY